MWFTDGGTPKAIGRVTLELTPAVTTGGASAITTSGATVSASVTPLSTTTSVAFEYGTTTALGSSATVGSLPASAKAASAVASLAGLPSGSTIFYRVWASNASGRAFGATQSFKTGGSPPSHSSPPLTVTATKRFGNQLITLTTPAAQTCTARGGALAVTLSSTRIPGSHASRLRFAEASFYIDGGVRHVRKRVVRTRGRRRVRMVVTHSPNAVLTRLPATSRLRLGSLPAGRHTLNVVLTYTRRALVHGHRRTVTEVKRLSVTFQIC